MTSRDFAYWLQGFFELNETNKVTEKQIYTIKQHLNMVFVHEIDPSMGDKEHQTKLNNIHNKPNPDKPTVQELSGNAGQGFDSGNELMRC